MLWAVVTNYSKYQDAIAHNRLPLSHAEKRVCIVRLTLDIIYIFKTVTLREAAYVVCSAAYC